MADEIKPPVSGSMNPSSPSTASPPVGSSPLSPQIKIPSVSQVPFGASPTLPSNLPIGDIRSAQPNQPSQPTARTVMPSPAAYPLPPKVSMSSPPSPAAISPKPTVTSPAPASGQAPIFKSSIRTMQEDIAALKKGGMPAGFQIEKQSEKTTPVVERPVVSNPIPRPQTFSHIELGRLEKSKPLPSANMPPLAMPKITPLTTPPLGLTKPTIGLPQASSSSFLGRFKGTSYKKIIIYVAGGLVGFALTAYLIPYFASSPTKSVSPTPTPNATPTPIAIPGIEGAFSIFSRVSLTVGADIFDNLLLNINKDVLVGGEPGLYQIINPQSSLSYSFSSFMSAVLITIPEEIIPFVDNDSFYVSLMQKTDSSYSRGFIVKLKNDVGAGEALNHWESNISVNLEDLFALDIEQAASINFLDNTYQGTAVRYRNFPETFKTIDYAIVTTVDGSEYLVVANSRDHIYSIIDRVR